MKNILLLTCTLIIISFQLGCPHASQEIVVPTGFHYPDEHGITSQLDEPVQVCQPVGRVLDLDGNPIKQALVELSTENWSSRLSARFTDGNGRFAFSSLPSGEYSFKITKPGFAPIIGKFRIAEAGPKEAKFAMRLGS